MTAVQIKSEFSSLPLDEQLQLLHELWDQLRSDPRAFELPKADQQELHRRYEQHLADPSSAKNWNEVKAEIRGRG